MNAMLVFVMGAQGILAGFINGWYYEHPGNNLVSTRICSEFKINLKTNFYHVSSTYEYDICFQVNWIQDHVFNDVWKSERVGTLVYVIFAEIVFWGVVCGILHRLRIYWKL